MRRAESEKGRKTKLAWLFLPFLISIRRKPASEPKGELSPSQSEKTENQKFFNILKLSNVRENGNIIFDFTYAYDKSGYIIEETARQDGETVTSSYTYDGRGQLTGTYEVHPEYTLKIEYTYDNAGNRITEKVSKTQWGSTTVVTDLTNTYKYDGRGSVSELVNAVGKTQIKYGYGAYGETTSAVIGWNNPVTNPYRYNAERIDDVAGVPAFQYLRARYLNPYTASFLTQDSYLGNLLTPLSQNRYAYAHNNPVMYTDPSGHLILTGVLIAGLVIAGVGATTYFVADAVENDAINDYYKAEEDYEKAGQEVLAASDRISQIYQDMDAAYFAGDNTNVCKNYLSLVKEYANYGNAYAKTCFSFDEMSAQAERAGIAGRVKRFGFGMFATGLGIAAIGAAPALPSALGVYGTVADVVTMGGMVSGTTSIYFGTSDMTEGITGYNPVREQLFQGNAAAYAQAESLSVFVSELVILGGIIGYQTEQAQQKTSANFDLVKDNQSDTSTANPYDLQPTHSQTLSNKKMNTLIDDIKTNGIQEPIKYVTHDGEMYVVDGHHRLLAAKRLGLTEVPIQKVELPYAGYSTIDDLLWFD